MTIKLIDDALNIAIAGLIYGSEIWLAGAFALYVLSARERKLRKAGLAIPQPGITITIHPSEKLVEAPTEPVPTEPVPCKQNLDVLPLEVRESVLDAKPVAEAQTVLDTRSVAEAQLVVTRRFKGEKANPPQVAEKSSAVKTLAVPQKVVHKKIVSSAKIVAPTDSRPVIVCEPVDWKRWKVGDLRKASIYKACGVRIRPVGSRRNLPKGDLIAQYEQNLKRLTRKPPLLKVVQDQTA